MCHPSRRSVVLLSVTCPIAGFNRSREAYDAGALSQNRPLPCQLRYRPRCRISSSPGTDGPPPVHHLDSLSPSRSDSEVPARIDRDGLGDFADHFGWGNRWVAYVLIWDEEEETSESVSEGSNP